MGKMEVKRRRMMKSVKGAQGKERKIRKEMRCCSS